VKRVVRRAVALVTTNFGWKVLAVALAVVLWAAVSTEPELSAFASAPLEYKNLPGDLEISSSLIESVSLELRGLSGEIRGLGDTRRPSVILDMTGIHPGERTVSIDETNVRLPRGVHLVRSVPSQVHLEIERRAFRQVPVQVRFNSARQAGYEVDHFQVEPVHLGVVGPESHVARIHSVATDLIDLSGVVGRSQFRVNAFVEDMYVRFQSSPTVAVAVTMKKKK